MSGMKNKVFSRFLRRRPLRWNSGCSWSKPGVRRTRKSGSWSHIKNSVRENSGSMSHGNKSGQEKMERRGSRGEHLSLGRGKRLQLNSRNRCTASRDRVREGPATTQSAQPGGGVSAQPRCWKCQNTRETCDRRTPPSTGGPGVLPLRALPCRVAHWGDRAENPPVSTK